MSFKIRKKNGTGCTCPSCVSRCYGEPGVFLPMEINGLRRSDVDEVSRTWLNHEGRQGTWSMVRPKVVDGKCVYLQNDRCSIHQRKPYECRMVDHRTTEAKHAEIKLLITRTWSDMYEQAVR